MTISEKLSETIAQKERIASEVVLQSDKITEIKSGIYDILESEEIPENENKLAQLIDGSITEVTPSDFGNATKIQHYQFQGRLNLTSVEIGDSVTSIGNSAFEGCSKLTSVAISNSVTTIDSYAFSACGSLTSVVIPNSVTTIDSWAFSPCVNLTNVVIGNGVTSIGAYALRIGSSSNKATITMLGTTPPTIYSNTFNADYLQNIIVPKGCGDTYKNATNWSAFADYIVEASE